MAYLEILDMYLPTVRTVCYVRTSRQPTIILYFNILYYFIAATGTAKPQTGGDVFNVKML